MLWIVYIFKFTQQGGLKRRARAVDDGLGTVQRRGLQLINRGRAHRNYKTPAQVPQRGQSFSFSLWIRSVTWS